MKNSFFFLILLLFTNIFYAQNTSKTEEIKKNYKLSDDFIHTKEYDKAFENINLGLKNSEVLKDENFIAKGYFYLGNYYQAKKENQKAIENYIISLTIFRRLNKEEEIANCYYKIGLSNYISSNYKDALENYFEALAINENRNNYSKIALVLGEIAAVYSLTGDYDKRRNYVERAMKIYERLNDEKGVMRMTTSLGVGYQKEGNIKKAIEIYKVGLEMARKLGEERNESIFLGNIGSSYRRLGRHKESLEYLFKALSIKIKQERYTSVAHTYNDISETYMNMNNLIKAKEYAIKAIETAKGYSLHQERYGHFILSNIEYDLGDYKNSRNSLKAFQKLEDSIFSLDKIAKINDLQIKYETEKKNLKIENQEANIALQDTRNKVKNQWLLFGSLGLLSIFIFITLQKSKRAAKKEKLQQEKFSQDLLLSQEEERTRIARELHDSVGQQLTLIKRKAQNEAQDDIAIMTNTALEEVRSISRDLYPALLKQLGLKESIELLVHEYDEQTDLFFTTDIDEIDNHFKESTSLNFYRLVQECLNNIIKHASAKSVTVTIKKEGKKINALISDNGKGFDVNESKNKNSLGLKTIFERIKIMNGKLSIDSQLNSGTTFIFSIPVKNE